MDRALVINVTNDASGRLQSIGTIPVYYACMTGVKGLQGFPPITETKFILQKNEDGLPFGNSGVYFNNQEIHLPGSSQILDSRGQQAQKVNMCGNASSPSSQQQSIIGEPLPSPPALGPLPSPPALFYQSPQGQITEAKRLDKASKRKQQEKAKVVHCRGKRGAASKHVISPLKRQKQRLIDALTQPTNKCVQVGSKNHPRTISLSEEEAVFVEAARRLMDTSSDEEESITSSAAEIKTSCAA